jgi:hypothetical protein
MWSFLSQLLLFVSTHYFVIGAGLGLFFTVYDRAVHPIWPSTWPTQLCTGLSLLTGLLTWPLRLFIEFWFAGVYLVAWYHLHRGDHSCS